MKKVYTLSALLVATGIAVLVIQSTTTNPDDPYYQIDKAVAWSVPFIYPTNIDKAKYDWTMQVSTNLIDWSDYQPANTNFDVYITNYSKAAFFRMKGTIRQ